MMKKDLIRQAVADRMLEAALRDAPTSAESIVFFARNLGISVEGDIGYDEAGLALVEKIYRQLCREARFTEFLDRASFEQLMMYFFGQVLVLRQGARWIAYKGRDYVFRPLLVEFPDTGKGLDIAAICFDLIDNPGLAGASMGQALLRFFAKAKKIALIPT
jgi:hypothetical protein